MIHTLIHTLFKRKSSLSEIATKLQSLEFRGESPAYVQTLIEAGNFKNKN